MLPSVTKAESPWSEFHGSNALGVVDGGSIPSSWSDTDYAWRRDLGTYNVGSPVIASDRVFYLTSTVSPPSISLEAVDLKSGELIWTKPFPNAQHSLHTRNSYASSTPTVDKTHVFAAWSNPDHTMLKCFDHDGNEVWSRDFGTWQSQHGFGTSPRIYGDMVLLFNSQQANELKAGEKPGRSRMIAVNRNTGETIWETPLKTTRTCYGVPAIYQPGTDDAQVIEANTGNGMFGLDAKSGEMLWSLPVFKARCCSTPIIVGDLAIASAGSGGGGNHLVAVRIPKSKEEAPQEVYRIERGAPYVPTSALKRNRLFMVDDKGIASCANAATGEILWTKRIGGNFGSSPIVVGDTVLMISLDGVATLVGAGDEFKKIGEVELGGPVGSTPAYGEGRLLLRVGSELRCLLTSKE